MSSEYPSVGGVLQKKHHPKRKQLFLKVFIFCYDVSDGGAMTFLLFVVY